MLIADTLQVVNSFPSNFPIHTETGADRAALGRGYVFLKLGDSSPSILPIYILPPLATDVRRPVLLFVTFLLSFLVFAALLIRLNRLSERRRGVHKEDGMVREDMRWAEGREVVEKRVVYERGAWSMGRGGLPPVPRRGKITKHQRRGTIENAG